MRILRRQFLRLVGAGAVGIASQRIARAQAYPSRPVRIIVGFGAGGTPDIVARLVGQWLSERLGQQFIVENRPGAGTNMATEFVVRAPVDGYTLLLVTTTNTINAALYEKLNFDLLRDVTPIASISRGPIVMVVNPSVPAKTVPEFIAYARADPGKLNMASTGTGNLSHLSGELFKMLTGVNIVHVPYRGAPPAQADLLSGQVQVMFDTLPALVEQVKSGKLRALAVGTSARWEALPDVPTMGEFVQGYEARGWYGLAAPKNMPASIVDTLNRETNAALADVRLKARLTELGTTVLAGSPADFGKLVADETAKWGKVTRAANIKPE
jgi:tripartite-type tricarboxylate transporter receptor subunit TctC